MVIQPRQSIARGAGRTAHMAIVTKHDFDGKLPPAALYLDDVEQILQILKNKTPDLYKPRQDSVGQPVESPDAAFKFTVGDTDCDTVEELRQLGYSTHELRVRTGWCDLDLNRHNAIWRSRFDNTEREVYGLMLPIFRARLHSVPLLRGVSPIYLLLQGAVIALLAVGGPLILLRRHWITGAAMIAGNIVLFLSMNKFTLPYSTVHFRRKH
jgi:hypothetical protein